MGRTATKMTSRVSQQNRAFSLDIVLALTVWIVRAILRATYFGVLAIKNAEIAS